MARGTKRSSGGSGGGNAGRASRPAKARRVEQGEEEGEPRPARLGVVEALLAAGMPLSTRELGRDCEGAAAVVPELLREGVLVKEDRRVRLATQLDLLKLPASELARLAGAGGGTIPADDQQDRASAVWKRVQMRAVLRRAERVPVGQAAQTFEPLQSVSETARIKHMWRSLQVPARGLQPRIVGGRLVCFDEAAELPPLPPPRKAPKVVRRRPVAPATPTTQARRAPRTGPGSRARRSAPRTTTTTTTTSRAPAAPAAAAGTALMRQGPGFARCLFGFEMNSKCFGLCVDETGGRVFVGSEDGFVSVLDLEGKPIKTLKLEAGVRCIVANAGHVFVGCNNGAIYDITEDRPRNVAMVEGFSEVLGIHMGGRGGFIVAADAEGQVALVNSEGEVVWKKKHSAGGNDGWLALVDDSGVYHGCSKGVTKYALEQGAEVWTRETGPVMLGCLSGSGDNLFAAVSEEGCEDDEMAKRLRREGAKSGEIVVSLMWNNLDDLDLHVIPPSGEEIYYGHKRSACGGFLDVDMNAGGVTSSEPVENVFWEKNPPKGTYKVQVVQYTNRTGDREVPFVVHVTVAGQKTVHNHTWRQGGSKTVLVDIFDYTSEAPAAPVEPAAENPALTDAPSNGVVQVDARSGDVKRHIDVGASVPSVAVADSGAVFVGLKKGVRCMMADKEFELPTATLPQTGNYPCSPMTMVTSADGSRLYALCGTRLLCVDVTEDGIKHTLGPNGPHTDVKIPARNAAGPVVAEVSGLGDLERASEDREGVVVHCVLEGSKLRIRPEPGQPGLSPSKNVQFPRNLRVEGRRFKVDRLVPVGSFYRVSGAILQM